MKTSEQKHHFLPASSLSSFRLSIKLERPHCLIQAASFVISPLLFCLFMSKSFPFDYTQMRIGQLSIRTDFVGTVTIVPHFRPEIQYLIIANSLKRSTGFTVGSFGVGIAVGVVVAITFDSGGFDRSIERGLFLGLIIVRIVRIVRIGTGIGIGIRDRAVCCLQDRRRRSSSSFGGSRSGR